jgi:hypothetical protein
MGLIYDGQKVTVAGQINTTPLQVHVPNHFALIVPTFVPKHKAEALASLASLVYKGKKPFSEVAQFADSLGVEWLSTKDGLCTFVEQPRLKRWIKALKRRLCCDVFTP